MGEALALVKRLLAAGVSASARAFKEAVPPLCMAAAIGNRQLFDLVLEVRGVACTRLKPASGAAAAP